MELLVSSFAATAVNCTSENLPPVHLGNGGEVVSQIVGWIYFIAWTVSFYPQIYLNWKRKSVIGLSFDYLVLNIIGFLSYSAFNVAFYFSSTIKDEFQAQNECKHNLVALNDVVFALHAVIACFITLYQVLIYDRGNQRVSWTCTGIGSTMIFSIVIVLFLSIFHVKQWIFFFYWLSYIKMAVTMLKYIPQAFLNYKRQSTTGWNIWNVLLDFTGGLLSVAQLFFDGWRTDNWKGVIGDPVKFGLGFTSMVFDIVFMIQHYGLYSKNNHLEERTTNSQYRKLDENV